jgi:hypothetical protein
VIERLVAVSRAAPGVGLPEVFAIIRAAHGRNRAAGLTGALVHLDGWFAQVLEGERAPLTAAFGRIGRDPRHREIELRARERALCRLFRDHAMALRSRACLDQGLLDDFAYRPGFPVERFPSDVLVEFMVRAGRGRARPAPPRLDRGGAVF